MTKSTFQYFIVCNCYKLLSLNFGPINPEAPQQALISSSDANLHWPVNNSSFFNFSSFSRLSALNRTITNFCVPSIVTESNRDLRIFEISSSRNSATSAHVFTPGVLRREKSFKAKFFFEEDFLFTGISLNLPKIRPSAKPNSSSPVC